LSNDGRDAIEVDFGIQTVEYSQYIRPASWASKRKAD
jgi:hypothetical protein